MGGYLDDAANDNYVLLVKLAAGSEDIPTVDIVANAVAEPTYSHVQ